MLRAALKGVLAHKVRLALTALAIVAGVAFVSGTFVLTDTLQGAFDDLFGVINQGIDVTVRAETTFNSTQSFGGARERVSETLLDEIRGVPGVAAAEGTVTGFAQYFDKAGEPITTQGAPTFGVSVSTSPELEIATLRSGRAPQGPDELVMDAGTAETNGFAVGDRVTVLLLSGKREFTLVGTFGFDQLDSLLGATIAGFDTATAQEVLESPGMFDSIDIAAADGVAATDLAPAISQILPEGVEAITQDSLVAEQSAEVSEGFLSIFNVVLLVFAGIAVFVGAFIIANTFSIIVAQRLRELALMRAIGATGGQVTVMVLIETLVVAVLASAVGVVAGIGVAVGLQSLLGAFGIDLPSSGLVVRPRTVIVGMAVGLVVTMGAALLPARTAARIPPMAALSDRYELREASNRRRLAIGAAATSVGVVLLLAGLFTSFGNGFALVGLGAASMFLGVAALSPLFAGRAARAIGAPASTLAGMTGRLAQENAGRRPTRTAATAAALMIGLALVSFTLIFGNSLKVSTGEVIESALSADFVVQPTGFQPFPAVIGEQMAELPEISVATGVRPGQFKVDGQLLFLNGVDPDEIGEVSKVDFLTGGYDELTLDTIMVHRDAAEARGWSYGDTIRAEFAVGGVVDLRIAGIYEAEKALIGEYNIGYDTYRENFLEELDQVVLADAAPGVDIAAARAALETVVVEYPLVKVENQAEFRQSTEDQINQLLGVVSAMLALALLIALLGITNTLALSVYERTREIGLLRAVGMTRRQVRSMIGFEAVIVSVFGAVLGLLLGTFFAAAVVRAAADQGFTAFAPPYGTLLGILVIATIAGAIAAWSPARKAARLNVLDAISYE